MVLFGEKIWSGTEHIWFYLSVYLSIYLCLYFPLKKNPPPPAGGGGRLTPPWAKNFFWSKSTQNGLKRVKTKKKKIQNFTSFSRILFFFEHLCKTEITRFFSFTSNTNIHKSWFSQIFKRNHIFILTFHKLKIFNFPQIVEK